MSTGTRRPAAGLVVAGLAGLALLSPGLRAYGAELRHQQPPVRAVQQSAGPGLSFPMPAGASPCNADVEAEAESALHLPVKPMCLSAPVGSRALDRWMGQQLPSGQPHDGQPWCDRQVLADGAILRRWGTTTTAGTLVSGALAVRPWAALVVDAPPCG